MNQDYQNLSKRQKNKQYSQLKTVNILTNQYQFRQINQNTVFYLYEISSKPQLQKDMSYLYRKMLTCHYDEINKLIKVYTRSGNYLWGTKKLSIVKTILYKSSQENIQFQIKLIKQIQYIPQNMVQIKHMLNAKINQIVIKNLKFTQMGKGVYFQNKIVAEQFRLGLKAMKGFKFTICYIDSMLFLQINRKIRILRQQNFLQTLNIYKHDDFKGKNVMKNYGNKRTHQIIQIDHSMNPLSTFKDSQGNEITFKTYYLRYNEKIHDLKQPLIKCYSRRPIKKINKQNKIIQYDREIIYLVPELVSLVLTTNKSQKYDTNFTRQIRPDPITKLTEIQQDFICPVNSNNKEIKINDMRSAIGYQAENVIIKLKNNSIKTFGGSFKIKQPIRQPTTFKDILIVHSVGKQLKKDRQQIDTIIGLFKLAGETIGIKVKVGCLQIRQKQRDLQEWINQINKELQKDKNQKPQLILVAFQQNETFLYKDLKIYITDQLKIISQFFIRRKLIKNDSKALSIASNILLQMASKFGKIIWQIQSTIKQKVILGSLIIQKQKNKYSVVLNGSRNQKRNKYYSERITITNKVIDNESFKSFLHSWLKCCITQENFIPQIMIFYRLDINQPFQKEIYQQEIQTIKQQFQLVKKKKNKHFNSTLIYITVTLKSSTKIFQKVKGNIPGSFAQNAINPQPGLFMQGKYENQFYLIGAKCNQGSANPVKYIIRQNNSNLSKEQIIQLCFEQCHNYQNWQGSIRIPAVLQHSLKYFKFPSKSQKIRGKLNRQKFYI